MEQLLRAELAGQRLKYLPFWGHTAPAGEAIGPHVLSQWFPHPFEHAGVTYRTAEHFMMAAKARLFDDSESLSLILDARSPAEAKKLGRGVRGFASDVWDDECLAIVREGSIAKFGSSTLLTTYLVGTGDRVLVEASPTDRVWGIGIARDNPAIERPSAWQGANLLGFALMQARAVLSSGDGCRSS